jgi:hypothetical protein
LGNPKPEWTYPRAFGRTSRIPNCCKYELPEGYRLVFQRIESTNEHLALFVGSHDEVDHFLDSHKGWIFDPVKHTLKELRYNTATEDTNNIVRSPELLAALDTAVQQPPAFDALSEDQLKAAGVPETQVQLARSLGDPNSLEAMRFLQELPQGPADILLSYVTGSKAERAEIEAMLRGERAHVPALTASQLVAIEAESDQFIDLADLPSEKEAFEAMPFEDWMLYLHPDQKAHVAKTFTGPARLRGVSGSGKTVVAIHRARAAARRNLANLAHHKILFVTYNKSLAELVRRLLKRLCTTQEFALIEVSTHGRWCQDYLRFRTGKDMAWKDEVRDRIWTKVIAKHLPRLHQLGFCLKISSKEEISTRDKDIQFLSDEIELGPVNTKSMIPG